MKRGSRLTVGNKHPCGPCISHPVAEVVACASWRRCGVRWRGLLLHPFYSAPSWSLENNLQDGLTGDATKKFPHPLAPSKTPHESKDPGKESITSTMHLPPSARGHFGSKHPPPPQLSAVAVGWGFFFQSHIEANST